LPQQNDNLCFLSIQISFQNDKKCRLKISFGCGSLGSGCCGLRYRFGNPRLIVIPNEVKQSSLRMNAVSEAISKGIPTHSMRDCFALSEKGLAMTCVVLRATSFAMLMTNEGEAVPAVRLAHRRPPHPSRNSPPPPLFEKERGDADNSFYYCSPSLTLLERGNKKGVSKKRKGQCENCFIQLFPSLSQGYRGGIKGGELLLIISLHSAYIDFI